MRMALSKALLQVGDSDTRTTFTNFTAEPVEMDPRAFAEPEDVVSKLPANLQAALASSKWKERKEVLDELLSLLNATLRIKDSSEFADLSKSLATCIHKDANINCVMVSAQCLEALAKGLGNPFGRYREALVPPMLERLKERKATVTDTIGSALDAIFITYLNICKFFDDVQYFCCQE